MTTSKMFRMRLSTYKKLRHYFPGKRGESAAEYFERLVEDVIIGCSEAKE